MEEEKYGINIDHAHKRAVELIPEAFFWSCADELAPFGSDEGDLSLAEYRTWREENPTTPTIEYLKWVVESLGEMDIEDYNEKLLDRDKLKESLADENYDDQYYIRTLDITVIASGFAQLVDEGIIETPNKPIIQLAIDRQMICAQLLENWEHAEEYTANLKVLSRALQAS